MNFDFEQHYAFQQKQWQVQRLAWVAMGLFFLFALLGLMGNGPLATQEVHNEQTRLVYQRILRLQQAAVLELETQSQASELRLEISRAFLDGFELEAMVPQPLLSQTGPVSYVYIFQTSPGRVKLSLRLKPRRTGGIVAEWRLHQPLVEPAFWDNPQSGGPHPMRISTTRIRFSQWVHP